MRGLPQHGPRLQPLADFHTTSSLPASIAISPIPTLSVRVAYKTKAGLNDLYHETLKIYPAAIAISAEGREIANGNCLRCHFSTVQNTPMGAGGADCLKCHRFSVHQRGLEKGGGIIVGQQ